MTGRFLFDAETIREAFNRLDAELVRRGLTDVVVVVVGGAALAIGDYRDRSTTDVDTVTELEPQVREAIAAVADAQDDVELADQWFNDNARAWRPVGMDIRDCKTHYEGDALTVLVPHARWLFLMKLNRSNLVDLPDLRALWPHTEFVDAESAADAFRAAYPGEEIDAYMANHIQREVIDRVGD